MPTDKTAGDPVTDVGSAGPASVFAATLTKRPRCCLGTRRPYRHLIDDRQVDNYHVFLDYSQQVLDRTTAKHVGVQANTQ